MGTALAVPLAAVTAAAEDLEIGGTVCAAFRFWDPVVNCEIPSGMTSNQKPWTPLTVLPLVSGDHLRRGAAPL